MQMQRKNLIMQLYDMHTSPDIVRLIRQQRPLQLYQQRVQIHKILLIPRILSMSFRLRVLSSVLLRGGDAPPDNRHNDLYNSRSIPLSSLSSFSSWPVVPVMSRPFSSLREEAYS